MNDKKEKAKQRVKPKNTRICFDFVIKDVIVTIEKRTKSIIKTRAPIRIMCCGKKEQTILQKVNINKESKSGRLLKMFIM